MIGKRYSRGNCNTYTPLKLDLKNVLMLLLKRNVPTYVPFSNLIKNTHEKFERT